MTAHLRFRSWCHFWGICNVEVLAPENSKTVRVMGYDLLLIVSIESYPWRLPIHVTIVGIYRTKHIMQGKYHNRRYPARAEESPT